MLIKKECQIDTLFIDYNILILRYLRYIIKNII